MNKLTFAIILIFGFWSVSSQSCLPEGITFTTQAQIDSFQVNYPGCTEIEGDVIIEGEDITNLNGLISLNTIGGDFIMYNTSLTTLSGLGNLLFVGGDVAVGEPTTADWPQGNPLLTDLSGLETLDSIGGNLYINGSSLLSNLSGLEGLIFVGGSFYIVASPLPSLIGLENLTFIGGGIYFALSPLNDLSPLGNLDSSLSFIVFNRTLLGDLTGLEGITSITEFSLTLEENDSLVSLSGLDNVTSIGGGLIISDNNALSNLTGLDNVTSIGGSVSIFSNDNLTSLIGFDNISSIGGDLLIYHNAVLNNLTGLYNLTSIGDDLRFRDNAALTSLAGLDNITAESIDDLEINDNDQLSECEVLSICYYLSNSTGNIIIENNAIGCNSPEEVLDSCESNAVQIDEQVVKDKLILYPNPSSRAVHLRYSISDIRYSIFEVYSLRGVKVRTLLNEVQQPGEYEITFDISDLPAGIYIVEALIDGRKVREKLVVR